MPGHILNRGWFRGGGRMVKSVELMEASRLPDAEPPAYLSGVRVEYAEGEPEIYALPLAFATGPAADDVLTRQSFAVLARVRGGVDGVVYDAMYDPNLTAALLKLMAAGRRLTATRGVVYTTLLPEAKTVAADPGPPQPRSPTRTGPRRHLTASSS